MKKILTITLLSVFAVNFHCSSMGITAGSINIELDKTAESIKKDRSQVYTLDQKKTGATGYYYIIRSDGRISYHPKKGLINFSFSDYTFAKKILKEKNGCLVSSAEGKRRYIFYREIGREEILCLTINSNEVDEHPEDCDSIDN